MTEVDATNPDEVSKSSEDQEAIDVHKDAKSTPFSSSEVKNELNEGYLEKQGGGNSMMGRKSWKKRYFVLDNCSISYYKEKGGALIKTLSFRNRDRVEAYDTFPRDPKHLYTFRIITFKRTLLMCAESENERDAWIREITKHIVKSEGGTLAERF